MNKKRTRFLCIAICFLLHTFAHAEFINDSLYISPLYTDPVQSSTVFPNPAEMAHWNNIAGLELRYRGRQNAFSGALTLKTPDFLIGNFAFSMEAFGSDFGNNLIWVPETDSTEAHFSLTKGGQKYSAVWAKRMEQATFGVDVKYYRYRELNTGREEAGAGLDAGFLYHPLERLYFGLVVNDLTNTEIYDSSSSATKNLLYSIPARIRVSAAFSPLNDLSFTAGAPVDIFTDKWDSRETWRKASFSVRKIWDAGLNLELGYNSRDAYASLGYIISDAINMKAVLSNDLTIKDGTYDTLFMFSAVLPARAWTMISGGVKEARKIMTQNDSKKGQNPLDFLFNMWLGVNDNLMTQSIYVDYANIDQVKRDVSDLLSPDGRIGVDYKRRRLIITDFKEKVMEILEAIRRMDQRARQQFETTRPPMPPSQQQPIYTPPMQKQQQQPGQFIPPPTQPMQPEQPMQPMPQSRPAPLGTPNQPPNQPDNQPMHPAPGSGEPAPQAFPPNQPETMKPWWFF